MTSTYYTLLDNGKLHNNRPSKVFYCIFGILLANIFILALFWESIAQHTGNEAYIEQTTVNSNISQEELRKLFSCTFEELDPWNSDARSFYRKYFNKTKEPPNCSFYTPTALKDGEILIQDDRFSYCNGRCGKFVNRKSIFGKWMPTNGTIFECDFVGVQCFKENQSKSVWTYLHSQVFEKKARTIKRTNTSLTPMPNIYIFVVDSLSKMHAKRVHRIDLVPHVICRLILRWRILDANRKLFFQPKLSRTVRWETVCKSDLDDDPLILKQFESIGYRTFFADEWPDGDVFTYPKCQGFRNPPTTHYYTPFHKLGGKNNWCPKKCRPFIGTTTVLNYWTSFANAYNGAPKASVAWLQLGHNDDSIFFPTDLVLKQKFEEMAQQLNDSFVILMGDHGQRVSDYAQTERGHLEANNPAFVMSVPATIRQNTHLMENLNINSRQLITMYDLHATLLDIKKLSSTGELNSHTDFSFIEQQNEKGLNPNNATSLIRELGPYTNRTCLDIPIDGAYCICEFKKIKCTLSETDIQQVGEFLVNKINENLNANDITKKACKELKLKKIFKAVSGVPETMHLHEIFIETTPGRGRFSAIVSTMNSLELRGDIVRMNAYGNAPHCIMYKKPLLRPYCVCK